MAYIMLQEHHDQFMRTAKATEVGLHSLTGTHGVLPACVTAAMMARIPAVALLGCTLSCDTKDSSH
jgi:uncharacterized metal-binding protein